MKPAGPPSEVALGCGAMGDGGDGAQETMDVLMEISTLLNTGLDRATLQILVELIEAGVHPEALARVVLELRRELQAVREKEERCATSLLHDA
ncbi:hypothetical protein BESB_055410 [Besnoitia besnoiti]|uniref:Mitotic-spindle organizing protein 1 n=1 Tax=Besnoitia besnoiti TaxID=94643 RepID=A0A2A9MKD4_BESBE|nr:hypothetical protein BESB_055410 [Besnoitia besnoiti]PFH35890.1 hypothetical protein BESB_055410 [Besnoitia besnoiti]